MGHNWKAIVNKYFPGRTALQARNQYNQFCRRAAFDTQPSTPGSLESPAILLPMDRCLSHVSLARTKSKRASLRDVSTDTDLKYDESDDNFSSEDDDDNDGYDGPWPHWDPPNEVSRMQAQQNPSHQYAISPHELESLASPLPSDGMVPMSCYGPLFSDRSPFAVGDSGTFEPASDHSYIGGQVWKPSILCE